MTGLVRVSNVTMIALNCFVTTSFTDSEQLEIKNVCAFSKECFWMQLFAVKQWCERRHNSHNNLLFNVSACQWCIGIRNIFKTEGMCCHTCNSFMITVIHLFFELFDKFILLVSQNMKIFISLRIFLIIIVIK